MIHFYDFRLNCISMLCYWKNLTFCADRAECGIECQWTGDLPDYAGHIKTCPVSNALRGDMGHNRTLNDGKLSAFSWQVELSFVVLDVFFLVPQFWTSWTVGWPHHRSQPCTHQQRQWLPRGKQWRRQRRLKRRLLASWCCCQGVVVCILKPSGPCVSGTLSPWHWYF